MTLDSIKERMETIATPVEGMHGRHIAQRFQSTLCLRYSTVLDADRWLAMDQVERAWCNRHISHAHAEGIQHEILGDISKLYYKHRWALEHIQFAAHEFLPVASFALSEFNHKMHEILRT